MMRCVSHITVKCELILLPVNKQDSTDDLCLESLRFLQQCCEGHFAPMQDYIRDQTNCKHITNIVRLAIHLAMSLCKIITDNSVELCIQIFLTLTELMQVLHVGCAVRRVWLLDGLWCVQGPCMLNQDVALDNKLLEIVGKIFTNDHHCNPIDFGTLKRSCVGTVYAMLGGRTNDKGLTKRVQTHLDAVWLRQILIEVILLLLRIFGG